MNPDLARQQLATLLQGDNTYLNYVYSYPHKTAYRALEPAVPLREAWADESKQQLFLYLHIPFCEMRCGYCNLFTLSRPEAAPVQQYLDALQRQARCTAEWLGKARFEQLALGGGTPTYLTPTQLDALFTMLGTTLGWHGGPTSVEVSPATVTPERLAVLRQHGVTRISMGIESFVARDLKALGRPQDGARLEQALEQLCARDFARLNLDLIYGSHLQDLADWRTSLARTVACQPHEIFIYPLYVRPLTGLGRRADHAGERLHAYRLARDYLREHGYRQLSMRQFIRADTREESGRYRCQEDGMISLGAGARSYTRSLHYSSQYAVGQKEIRRLLADYSNADDHAFSHARYGFRLDAEEQRRRYLLLGLLQTCGLGRENYRTRFGSEVLEDFPELVCLEEQGFMTRSEDALVLSETGVEQSDLIGHWLFSARVRERMGTWQWR